MKGNVCVKKYFYKTAITFFAVLTLFACVSTRHVTSIKRVANYQVEPSLRFRIEDVEFKFGERILYNERKKWVILVLCLPPQLPAVGGLFRRTEYPEPIYPEIEEIIDIAESRYPQIFSDERDALPLKINVYLENYSYSGILTSLLSLSTLLIVGAILPLPESAKGEFSVETSFTDLSGRAVKKQVVAFERKTAYWGSAYSPLGLIPVPGPSDKEKDIEIFGSPYGKPSKRRTLTLESIVDAVVEAINKTDKKVLYALYQERQEATKLARVNAEEKVIAPEREQPKVTKLLERRETEKEAPSETFRATSGIAERWAVVIGISDYQDSRIPSLRYASRDAEALYNWIVSPEGGGYAIPRVKLLLDSDATGENIREALFEWLRQPLEEDMITIYFAGHGSPDSPDTPDNLFFLPYDTDYERIASTGFPMWDIETALRRFIKAKRIVIISDACHSGGVGKPFDIARSQQGFRGKSNKFRCTGSL